MYYEDVENTNENMKLVGAYIQETEHVALYTLLSCQTTSSVVVFV